MIFVDSGAWFASVVEDDLDHESAKDWFAQNSDRLVVTDYIIDETLTLLRARGENRKALKLGELFLESGNVAVHYLSENDIQEAWNIFRYFSDKGWSFTDCSSKYVCERLGIRSACSFDKHFRQFGSVRILP